MPSSANVLLLLVVITISTNPPPLLLVSAQMCGAGQPATINNACTMGRVQQRGYRDNTDCRQTLSAPSGSAVSLRFTTFSIEAHFDWLQIFDGPSTTAPLLGRFSGSTLPPPLTSTGSTITLRLTSDSSTTGAGFAATVSCLVPAGCDVLPDVRHGSAEACAALAHGNTCQLQCDSGFTSLNVPLVCDQGVPRSVLPTCARECRHHTGGMHDACPVSADGETAVGIVEQQGTTVYFAFSASAGTTYTIDVDIHGLPGGLQDSVLVLYDTSSSQLASNDDGLAVNEVNTGCAGHNEEGCASFLRWMCPVSAVYFAAVRGYGASTGVFTVSVTAIGRNMEPPPPLLQPDAMPLKLRTSCFLGSLSGTEPACQSQIHDPQTGIKLLGSGSSFVVMLDAVAGASFSLNLAIDDDTSLLCQDIGRADGLATAYCAQAHCPDFAPDSTLPTRGMCNESCRFCSATGRGSVEGMGLYATLTVFPEHAIGAVGTTGRTVWPSSSLALGTWELNSRSQNDTKQCIGGGWFCFFPSTSNSMPGRSFRWVSSGTGRFAIVVQPNCNIPAVAYPPHERAQHELACQTIWTLAASTPMMVTAEYDLLAAIQMPSRSTSARIATVVGVSSENVLVLARPLTQQAIVHIHTDNQTHAADVRAMLVHQLRNNSDFVNSVGGNSTGRRRVCVVPDRQIFQRTIDVTNQDPCVVHPLSPCRAQLAQMFQRHTLPVLAYVNSVQALNQSGSVTANAIAVAVDVNIQSLTNDRSSTTLNHMQQRVQGVRVASIAEYGLGHRRHLQSTGSSDNSQWCANRVTAVNRACCGAGDVNCDNGGVPQICDFACALAFIPYFQSCGHLLQQGALATLMFTLYAKCAVVAVGGGTCEQVRVDRPPRAADVHSDREVTVAVSITDGNYDGSDTLNLAGVEKVTLETTARPCVLASSSECAAQFVANFSKHDSGWSSKALRLDLLQSTPGTPNNNGISVRATVAIAATSDAHADAIMQTLV
jgi:hypothetical protein